MGDTSSIVIMNIRYLGKIITDLVWGKIVMTSIDKRGNTEMIYIIKFKNLKIKNKGNERAKGSLKVIALTTFS